MEKFDPRCFAFVFFLVRSIVLKLVSFSIIEALGNRARVLV